MMRAMNTIHLYGIPNCDTVKKARDWLTAQGVDYAFHDFKKLGVPADLLPGWLHAVGRDTLINRKGPTWRKLGPEVHATVVDDASATAVMLAHSSVIKRPVVVWADSSITVGFKPEWFAERLL
jgi:Spx/MgsR family transcriptional regulator